MCCTTIGKSENLSVNIYNSTYSGISTLSGHYATFVHSSSDWFRIDDNQVKL